MTGLRAIPRNSVAMVVSALMLAAALVFNALYSASGDNHDQTYYACLYAGSLSQVNTIGMPSNCGRGAPISWNATGPAGEPGEAGATHVFRRETDVNVPANDVLGGYAECETGETLTGGGFHGNGTIVMASMPLPAAFPHPSYYGMFSNPSGAVIVATVYALCASP